MHKLFIRRKAEYLAEDVSPVDLAD